MQRSDISRYLQIAQYAVYMAEMELQRAVVDPHQLDLFFDYTPF